MVYKKLKNLRLLKIRFLFDDQGCARKRGDKVIFHVMAKYISIVGGIFKSWYKLNKLQLIVLQIMVVFRFGILS